MATLNLNRGIGKELPEEVTDGNIYLIVDSSFTEPKLYTDYGARRLLLNGGVDLKNIDMSTTDSFVNTWTQRECTA